MSGNPQTVRVYEENQAVWFQNCLCVVKDRVPTDLGFCCYVIENVETGQVHYAGKHQLYPVNLLEMDEDEFEQLHFVCRQPPTSTAVNAVELPGSTTDVNTVNIPECPATTTVNIQECPATTTVNTVNIPVESHYKNEQSSAGQKKVITICSVIRE